MLRLITLNLELMQHLVRSCATPCQLYNKINHAGFYGVFGLVCRLLAAELFDFCISLFIATARYACTNKSAELCLSFFSRNPKKYETIAAPGISQLLRGNQHWGIIKSKQHIKAAILPFITLECQPVYR